MRNHLSVQLQTFSILLTFTLEAGFTSKYSITNKGILSSIDNRSNTYTKDSINIIHKLDCPSDKSTIWLFKIPNNQKGYYIEYWENRFN